jgi:hypothetical protein
VVAGGADAAIGAPDERVVVVRAAHICHAEAFTHLNTFDGRDAEHCLADIGLQLIEDWLAQARWHTACAHLHHATE